MNWGSFAILYRTNAQSRPFEEILVRLGIPYTIVGEFKFYDRKEIKDVIAYLRAIANPADTVSLLRIINTTTVLSASVLFGVEDCAENSRNSFAV